MVLNCECGNETEFYEITQVRFSIDSEGNREEKLDEWTEYYCSGCDRKVYIWGIKMKRYKVWIVVEEYDTKRLDDGTECQSNWHEIEMECSNECVGLVEAKKIFNPLVDKLNESR